MVDVYLDMSKNGFWNGTLTGIRLDPVESSFAARFEVELIEILDHVTDISSVGVLSGVKRRLGDVEDRLDDIEGQIDDLESSVDEVRCGLEEANN